ncbi:putative RNA helicase SDE3 [Tasmannia lanceolata]|uniref:putative RNA helicase SDE3 n=1 Tax=Tasmannia lanceolata TaxID=3420 RepID=UPI004062F12A
MMCILSILKYILRGEEETDHRDYEALAGSSSPSRNYGTVTEHTSSINRPIEKINYQAQAPIDDPPWRISDGGRFQNTQVNRQILNEPQVKKPEFSQTPKVAPSRPPFVYQVATLPVESVKQSPVKTTIPVKESPVKTTIPVKESRVKTTIPVESVKESPAKQPEVPRRQTVRPAVSVTKSIDKKSVPSASDAAHATRCLCRICSPTIPVESVEEPRVKEPEIRARQSVLSVPSVTKSVDKKSVPSASNPQQVIRCLCRICFPTIPVESMVESQAKQPEIRPRQSVLPEPSLPLTVTVRNGSDPPSPPKSAPIQKSKSGFPVYVIPEDLKDLIERDRVPDVLRKPLSLSTYADYFATLLYAEDYYLEKWSKFILKGVTLELLAEWTSKKSVWKNNKIERLKREKKTYVVFQTESIPEKRPYLLSRDSVFLKPTGKEAKPFEGILSRVKSKRVYTEFGDDFHSQHSPTCTYDISFSFNRVCLKRSHHAVAAAMDPSFQILFPKPVTRTNYLKPTSVFLSSHNFHQEEISAIHQILNLKSPPAYLIEGPLSVTKHMLLSRTGLVIREAILQIYRTFPESRILVTSPKNSTCDSLLRSLKKEIPEGELFRANAAFRELEDVPDDILASSAYELNKECFTCPSLKDLMKFKVITSTFVSSFRLHNTGINAGHFTHIFLVDASNATEPEVMVTLANLVDEKTTIVVTGCLGYSPERVRSVIGRRNGLKRSYFLRLLNSEPYSSRNPMFVGHLRGAELPDDSISVSLDF